MLGRMGRLSDNVPISIRMGYFLKFVLGRYVRGLVIKSEKNCN
jgi:hypothetical protein